MAVAAARELGWAIGFTRWPVVQVTKRALAAEDRTGRRGLWLRMLDRFGVGFDT